MSTADRIFFPIAVLVFIAWAFVVWRAIDDDYTDRETQTVHHEPSADFDAGAEDCDDVEIPDGANTVSVAPFPNGCVLRANGIPIEVRCVEGHSLLTASPSEARMKLACIPVSEG